jgi:hypothetical protein
MIGPNEVFQYDHRSYGTVFERPVKVKRGRVVSELPVSRRRAPADIIGTLAGVTTYAAGDGRLVTRTATRDPYQPSTGARVPERQPDSTPLTRDLILASVPLLKPAVIDPKRTVKVAGKYPVELEWDAGGGVLRAYPGSKLITYGMPGAVKTVRTVGELRKLILAHTTRPLEEVVSKF